MQLAPVRWPESFEPLKVIAFGLAVLLLTPIGIVFWRISVHKPWPKTQAALQEQARGIGTTQADGSVVVAVQTVESIGFSERTLPWLSFYPRPWIGIVGLLAVVTILVCLLVSLFMPVVSELSKPPR